MDVSLLERWLCNRDLDEAFDPDVLGVAEKDDEDIPVLTQYIKETKRGKYERTPEWCEGARARLAERLANPEWRAMYSNAASEGLKAAWENEEFREKITRKVGEWARAQWQDSDFRINALQKCMEAGHSKKRWEGMTAEQRSQEGLKGAATRASHKDYKTGYACLECDLRYNRLDTAKAHFDKKHVPEGKVWNREGTLNNWKEGRIDDGTSGIKKWKKQPRLPCPAPGCKKTYVNRTMWKGHFDEVHPGMDLKAPILLDLEIKKNKKDKDVSSDDEITEL